MNAEGGCLCGGVRFTAHGVSKDVHACHCTMCRRWSGGPGLAVEVESLRFGSDALLGRYDSSEWAERGFCTRCGSSLFYRLKQPDSNLVWLGSLDDQSPFALHGEIYVDEKPAAYALDGEHPRLTGAEFLASIGGTEAGPEDSA